MDNHNVNKLTKELMADSRLNLTRPDFDDAVMNLILLESNKQKNRKNLFFDILIFSGIELVVFALLLILLLRFPGNDFFTTAVRDFLPVFQKIGKLAIEYNYLILSFIVVGILDWFMNRTERLSVKI
jgi:hypothetical protein